METRLMFKEDKVDGKMETRLMFKEDKVDQG
jgi:hypothetical protein